MDKLIEGDPMKDDELSEVDADDSAKRRLLEIFNEHRSLLFSIAYRMLGTVAAAEDKIQETFLRWQRVFNRRH